MGIQYQVFCPVCGLNHHDRVEHDPERPSQVIGRHNFWEDVANFDPAHPYGVILESQGRGTLRVVRYFAANEDPTGAFPLVKARMLAALQEWIAKGYIDKDEAAGAVAVAVQGPPLAPYSPARVVESAPPKAAAPAKVKPAPKPKQEKKAPKPKKEELLGPKLPKVKKAKPPKTEKKAPPPAEKPKPKKKPEFEAPFSMSQLATGKFYYQDAKGKFVPPARWQEILDIEPGPQALTPEQYEAYRAELRQAEVVAEAARLKRIEEIQPGTWVRDTSGRDWLVVSREDPLVRVKTPQGGAARIGIGIIAQTNVPPPAVITGPPEVEERPKARPVVEEKPRAPSGVLVTVIPKGKNMLTLSEAFKALQDARYLRRDPLTPVQREEEETKFKKLLTQEMTSGAILGGAGQAGTLEENKRLRVGNVTGFIMRP